MSSTNQGFEYKKAESAFFIAETIEEKIFALEEMIRTCPKHKSSEKMLAKLRMRLAKLKKLQEEKARKKGGARGIKRSGDAQVVILGSTNVGRSSLLASLTNAKPKIAEFEYTTLKPELGTLEYDGCKIQLIELPALHGNIEADSESLSIARTSNLLLILIISNEEVDKILDELNKVRILTPKLIVANKTDIYARATKADVFISCKTLQNIEKLKEEIFKRLGIIRIFTKEPGKKPSERPLTLEKDSNVKELAKHIREDFVERFDFALIWGPSAKFPGQKVGLEHELKDKDIVEIHLKK